MKKITLTLTALFVLLFHVNAQNSEKDKAEKYLSSKNEITFTFKIEKDSDLKRLTHDMSLVNYDPETKTVKAWANAEQFRRFELLDIPYHVPKGENEVTESYIYDVRPLATRSAASTLSFPLSSYPTYAEYEQQMQDFEDDYPNLVERVSIGATGQGDKELLFVRISDNINTDEQEPKLMLTSSMHGDEIAGYPMMLTLIDYILTVYNDSNHPDYTRIQNLVENTEIWINPSANPDGTYHNSSNNTSVSQARRGNANNIDLNRNYPDNVAGAHYDGEVYQTETLAFMALADAHKFVISANFHGGTELVNYPFDNARTNQYVHPDTDWFENIGVQYATHCQTNANAGLTSTPTYNNKFDYMTDDDDWDASGGLYPNNYIESPGVTHGAEWYRVYGGRQDYMNYYQHCKEITIELSDDKILQESKLDDYWYYNRDALLDFLIQGTLGYRGLVLDANTNNPIEDVKVTVVGHDDYGSEIYTDNHGAYYRPIAGGNYSLQFEAPCYQTFTMPSVGIMDGQQIPLADVLLTPLTPSVPSGLSVSSITTSSATLEWASSGSTFDLRYKEFGSTTWIDVLGLTSNSYNVSGLTSDTTYEFEVRSSCGAVQSAYSSTFSFATLSANYCSAQGNSVNDEYISRVELNTIDNNSGAQGYSDFTNISTTLITGENYTITVTPTWTSTVYQEGYRVWIDYNRDGSFTNAERVMNQSPTNSASVSASFTVPAGAVEGNTRMRVSMRYDARPSACGTFDYGEVEDYTINLFDGLVYSANTWTPSAPTNSTGTKNVLIEDGTYNVNNSDISMNNLTVKSGAAIIVDKNSNVSVGGSILNFGEFTLNSDSNEFSSLMVDGSVNGNVKYNRHVTSNAGGNDIIAPPVSGETFTSFISNNSNIFSNSTQTMYLFGPFEKPTNDYGLFANTEASTLDAATGYRAASTDDGTFTFEGTVTTGSLNVPIIKTGVDFAKWNLIGNPYTSYIKLEDFLNANLNELDAQSVAVYGYDGDDSDGSVWTIWNKAYSDNNPGSLIAPGQGFFVSSKDGGSTVSFTPSMRTTGASDDFMSGRNSGLAHFVITMSSTNDIHKTDIYFKDNATSGLDIGYDAELFEEEPSPYSIYSELTENGQDLNMAIQSIGFDDVNSSTVIPIGINLMQGQQVAISMNTSNIDYDVYFEDTLMNTVTLLNNSDYMFTANSDLFGTGRFYLRFETETLSTQNSSLDNLIVYVNTESKQIIVNGELNGDTTFQLYDVQGREIIKKQLDASITSQVIDASSFSTGIYFVELTDPLGTISKKLIIR